MEGEEKGDQMGEERKKERKRERERAKETDLWTPMSKSFPLWSGLPIS